MVLEAPRFGQDGRPRSLVGRSLRESIRSRRGPVFGYGSRAIRVIGGVAETQWLTTLTGEVPRRPRAAAEPEGSIRRVEVTPLDKSLTKRVADAAER